MVMGLFFLLATPHGMWDLSFWTKDRTHNPCRGILNTGFPEKSLNFIPGKLTLSRRDQKKGKKQYKGIPKKRLFREKEIVSTKT